MAFTFYAKVDRSELTMAINQIGVFDGKTRMKVENIIDKGTNEVAKSARRKAPRRTGKLRKSIRKSFKKRDMTGRVKVMSPIGHLIEYGVKRTVVRPKKKKALHFKGRFAMKATIPRRHKRPFLQPAYDEHKNEIIEKVKKAVGK